MPPRAPHSSIIDTNKYINIYMATKQIVTNKSISIETIETRV